MAESFMLYSEKATKEHGVSQEFQAQLRYALEHSEWVTVNINMVPKEDTPDA